jgi:Dynamin family
MRAPESMAVTMAVLGTLAGTTAEGCQDESARSELQALADRLDAPLQVAVGGRMKAGKSTVVNALLGRQIAPTAATECTKVVARYRYGDSEGVRVVPRSGEPYAVPPTLDGGPPDDLGRPAADIDHIDVSMASSRRRGWALVDTPGLDSITEGVSSSTERSVLGDPDSIRAVSSVDGLLYLMPHPGERDASFLKDFAAVFDGTRMGAVNIVGVLSKIDLLDGAGRSDPRVEGARLARRKGDELAGLVDRVIPVSGLLGQASVAGAFRERHTPLIRALAAADQPTLQRALRRVERFHEAEDLGVERADRSELVRVLGLWGVQTAVEAYRQGATTTRGLVTALRAVSNLDELTAAVDTRLADGAALVRTAAALDDLERIAFRASLPGLYERVREIRDRPEFHRITEVQVLRRFDPERSRLSPDQRRQLRTVLRETDPSTRVGLAAGSVNGDIAAAAQGFAAEWRGVENGSRTRRSDQTVAAVLRRSYELIAAETNRARDG